MQAGIPTIPWLFGLFQLFNFIIQSFNYHCPTETFPIFEQLKILFLDKNINRSFLHNF